MPLGLLEKINVVESYLREIAQSMRESPQPAQSIPHDGSVSRFLKVMSVPSRRLRQASLQVRGR